MSNSILDSIKNSNVLVTGGCGFIGSEVTKQLSQIGANVTVIDNFSSGKRKYVENFSNVNIHEGDLGNETTMNSLVKEKDYIINLAALPFILNFFGTSWRVGIRSSSDTTK